MGAGPRLSPCRWSGTDVCALASHCQVDRAPWCRGAVCGPCGSGGCWTPCARLGCPPHLFLLAPICCVSCPWPVSPFTLHTDLEVVSYPPQGLLCPHGLGVPFLLSFLAHLRPISGGVPLSCGAVGQVWPQLCPDHLFSSWTFISLRTCLGAAAPAVGVTC